MEGIQFKTVSEDRSQSGFWDRREDFVICVDRKVHVRYREKSNNDKPAPVRHVVDVDPCDGTCQSKIVLPTEVEKAVQAFLDKTK